MLENMIDLINQVKTKSTDGAGRVSLFVSSCQAAAGDC